MQEFNYPLRITWEGNKGSGTNDYQSYERSFSISAHQKPSISGSSEPKFKGDPQKWNPEELLVASLSACHMLWYLHLCTTHKIIVLDYQDQASGTLILDKTGRGSFKSITLHPEIKIENKDQEELAKKLHEEAHHKCFIANSINFPVLITPQFV